MMDFDGCKAYTRRAFLQRGVTLASASMTIPLFVQSSAAALAAAAGRTSSIPGVPDERILLVVQFGGGNDGLNTVVPFTQQEYYDARPTLAIPERDVLKLDRQQTVGLHPALVDLKAMYDDGLVSIVQGVGYPNPNRSHFKSMDIWQTAEMSGVGDGWLGRYFDNECKGRPCPQGSVAIGGDSPLALQGRISKPISFESPELFRWTGEQIDEALETPYQRMVRTGALPGVDPASSAAFLMRTALDAQVSSDLIRKAAKQRPLVRYPRSELAQQLAMIASMIRAGLPTRVYYVTLGSFDTHARQGSAQGRHGTLLQRFAKAMRAFYSELKMQGDAQRVLTMSFSEFGRRVGQNASGGTDHGTAAPMFLLGPMVRPGVLGEHPSMRNLDAGDLKHTLDFRSVYAGVLGDWFRTDPTQILGAPHRMAKVIRTR